MILPLKTRAPILKGCNSTNDVAEDKRKAILLSRCGVATSRVMNLTAPEKPTDKTFAQLVQLVGEHHNPKPSVIVETLSLQQESVPTFIAELRHLTQYCDFGDSLKDMTGV